MFLTPAWHGTKTTWLLTVLAVAAFEAAYEYETAAGLIVVYLACLFSLAWVKTPRRAFYLGLAIGTATAGLQLTFFYGIFGPMAMGLWAILGLWIALFLLLARIVVERWPHRGAMWLPVLWFGLEYFRCELYYLRFAWLTPGFALSGPRSVGMAAAGVYGFSFCVLSLLSILALTRRRTAESAAAACFAPLLFLIAMPAATAPGPGPYVAGVQLEGPTVDTV
ncbi:MAG: hypothetical protein HY290_16115, partial [Planctomycetia bacterium]|nr:hypothetical protein [Planctomycetia bacterium]